MEMLKNEKKITVWKLKMDESGEQREKLHTL